MEQQPETHPGLYSPEPEQREPEQPRLYSPGNVAVATLIGSHFAGALVMAINYKRLGKPSAARWSVLIGLVTLVALLAAAVMLPFDWAFRGLAIGLVFAMHGLAKALQGAKYEEVYGATGRKASGWGAAGIGVLCSVAILAAILGYGFWEDARLLGKSVELAPGEEVYYGGDISEEEATKLGRGLKEQGFELKDITMRLSREAGRLRISVVVVEGAWEDPEVLSLVSNIAVFASTELYEKKPVDAAIWDEGLTVRKLVRYEEALAKVLKEQVKEDGAKKESAPKG